MKAIPTIITLFLCFGSFPVSNLKYLTGIYATWVLLWISLFNRGSFPFLGTSSTAKL